LFNLFLLIVYSFANQFSALYIQLQITPRMPIKTQPNHLFSFVLLAILSLPALKSSAQDELKLVTYVDSSSIVGYKQDIIMRGFLKNVSNRVMKITKPTPYAMWKTDNDTWVLMKNKQSVSPYKFVERPDRKFKKSDLIDLNPGDSVRVSTYQWNLDVEGDYEIKLKYEQLKDNIEILYVDPKLLQDRQDFKLESNTISFTIKKPIVVVRRELIPYEKLILSEIFYEASPSAIYLRPNDVNRLVLAKGSSQKLFPDCKNVQYLRVDNMDEDSIPDAFASWNLQYLEMFKGGTGPVYTYVPKGFCASGNLRYLHFNYGIPEKLPDWMFTQKKLEYLRIFGKRINTLDDRFGEFTNLKFLDLGNIENAQAIPSSFANLVNLEELSLIGDGLKDVSAIEHLPKLKTIKIWSNEVNKDNEVLKRMKLNNKDLNIMTKYGMVM